MCNVAKLKGKIMEKGYSQITFAKKVGLARSTLSRKLKTGEGFTIAEANKIAKALELNGQEAISIFFTNSVA